jgi:glutamine amidotransferase
VETVVFGAVMAPTRATIVDYGMGNLWSVHSALNYLGAIAEVSDDPTAVAKAECLVLPGVGSFNKAMKRLNASGLSDAILEAVLVRKRKILGICLGMQLMAELGTEDGDCSGLALISGVVGKFSESDLDGNKLPHIGFNRVMFHSGSRLFSGLGSGADFYFVHSYRLPGGNPFSSAVCSYGTEFTAALERDNVYATQFHPEKSQTNGLKLLSNFLSI